MKGSIDEVPIYERALSVLEITDLYTVIVKILKIEGTHLSVSGDKI